MSSRAKVWFGNLRSAFWMPAPSAGMEATSRGRIEKVDLANGGSFVSQSQATHREYDMEWKTVEHDEIRPLYDYRSGLRGSGLLYFCDPWVANALPPHWAEPALTGDDWPSLYSSGVKPSIVGAGTIRTNWIFDPNATSVSAWVAGGATVPTVSAITRQAGAVAGFNYIRITANLAASAYSANAASTFPVVAGEAFAASVYVRGTTSRSAQIRVTWTGATATTGTLTAIASSTAWQRLTYTGTVPVGATAARVDVLAAATSVAVGNYVEFDGLLFERGTSTVGVYFDGSALYTDGRAVSWSAAANNSASTLSVPVSGMPMRSATYTISTPLAPGAYPRRSSVLLIPPTQTLWLGFSGSSVGDAVIRVQPVNIDGSMPPPVSLTLLATSGSTRMNASFSGSTYSAVIIYLDTNTLGSSTITLNSGKAVYATTGTPPVLTGLHENGEGHTGMRFQSDITRVYHNLRGVDGTQLVSAAVSLTEIGAWA